MAAPTVYRSTDTSAPVLDGTAGSLVNLLDKCLVAGYGSQTAAGWTKPFTATNKAVFLPSAGHYLNVDDSGAGAATTQEANVRGYETMTAVATGTNLFPTTSQSAAPGLYIRKSAATGATSRSWVLVADAYTFHLFVLSGDAAGQYQSFSFGRFYSFKTSDSYRSVILAHSASGGAVSGGLDQTIASSANSATNGAYIPRTYLGTGTSVQGSLKGLASTLQANPYTGPNPVDGNIYLSRLFVDEASFTVGLRGYLRGLYQIITATGLSDGDTFTGSGSDFGGRTFLVLNKNRNGAYFAIETSAWDSST